MAIQREEEEKTLVLWNISNCPIPGDFDPCLVRVRIESALKNSGSSGPLTITAIGNLTQILGEDDNDVLRKLSSTGIALKYDYDIDMYLYKWTYSNPSPAKIMLISDHKELEQLAPMLYDLEREGYSIMLAYLQRAPALGNVFKKCLWKSLLSDDMETDNKQETTRLVLHSESPWYCALCSFAGQSFEDFSTHLKSEKHAFREWDLWTSRNNVDRTNPANLIHGRSKEWDLLNKQDMELRKRIRSLMINMVESQ